MAGPGVDDARGGDSGNGLAGSAALARSAFPAVFALASRFQLAHGGELEEMIGDGMFGLAQAVSRFDAARWPGNSFSTYARGRIAGAISDGHRRRIHFVRSHRGPGEVRLVEQLVGELPPAAAASAEDVALEQLDVDELLAAVAALSAPLRRAVVAVLAAESGKGADLAGVGLLEGVSASRISQRLALARASLTASGFGCRR